SGYRPTGALSAPTDHRRPSLLRFALLIGTLARPLHPARWRKQQSMSPANGQTGQFDGCPSSEGMPEWRRKWHRHRYGPIAESRQDRIGVSIMAELRVAAERTIEAPPDQVYGVLADYQQHHPRILPPAF